MSTSARCKKNVRIIDFESIQGANEYKDLAQNDYQRSRRVEKQINEDWNELEAILLKGNYCEFRDRIYTKRNRNMEISLLNLLIKIMAIQESIRDDDLITVKQLLDDEKIVICKDDLGRTPLHLAVLFCRKRICEYLVLFYPWTVNIIDKEGRSPLHYASVLPNDEDIEDITKLLIRAGAEENILDLAQNNPADYRINKQKAKMVYQRINVATVDLVGKEDEEDANIDEEIEKRILGINFHKTTFHELEQIQYEGKLDMVWRITRKHFNNKSLIEYLSRFRSVQKRLKFAMQAIENCDLHKVKCIIDNDIIEAHDKRGFCLIHVAVLREQKEITEYIATEYPQCIDFRDLNGRTALHYASAQNTPIYNLLIECGAQVDLIGEVKNDDMIKFYQNQHNNHRLTHGGNNLIFQTLVNECGPNIPTDEEINEWLNEGNIIQLEKLVLDGKGDRLIGRTVNNEVSSNFIDNVFKYQAKIDAIHKAVEEGDIRRVDALIDRGQMITARDKYGMTPLHKALFYGQTNTVRYLLTKYPHIVNVVDRNGRTALHYAASDRNGKHLVKMLQKSGADAFIEDNYGHTPFYYRTHGRRLNIRILKDSAVVNQLISGQLNRPLLQDLEEDVSDWIHTGNVGKLEELVLNGYADLLLGRTNEVEDADTIDFLEILPQYQAKIQTVHKAIEKGDLKCVKLLIDRKKMAFCRDNRHLTPLHKAILFSRIDITKYIILNYPQSVNALDALKRTPLHYAAALRDGGYMYKILRKAGADPSIYDSDGRPAKYYLKYPEDIDFLNLKLGTKAALEQTLQNRVAPSYLESGIQQWVREGNIGKLNQLVLSGCGDLLLSRNSTNADSASFLEHLQKLLDEIEAVHYAVKTGNLEKVKQTMVSKKLALARNQRGCTPLHTAIVYEQTEIVRYIVSNFPSVLNAPDYNKRTPMHYAAASRDGGHYMKILEKAGADSAPLDNEGRTPDYYRKNAVFDLKSIRGDDVSENSGLHYEFLEESPRDESPQSLDSVSLTGSSAGSDYQGGNGHHYKLEKYIEEKIDFPTSDNGIYLAQTVAPALTKVLAEVLLQRPSDPIAFIADCLSTQENYRGNGDG